FAEGAAYAEGLVAAFPAYAPFADRLAGLLFEAACAAAPREAMGDPLAAAAILHSHIARLEKLEAIHPLCGGAHAALAEVHHMRAVGLSAGDRPSQALGAAALAQTYRPGWPQARDTERREEEALARLAERVALAQVQRGSSARLSAEEESQRR